MDSPFSNTATEHELTSLRASSGTVPSDLSGLYIKNGPGDFKVCCEPLFVADPAAVAEDDGKLISLVVSPHRDASFLPILAAQDLAEICRIPVPGFSVPSVHSGFFPD
ncbi:MAG: carotenoid cleavage dioxygenase-like enzyme [Verrucomicrobiales bacterium]|jgi:carotenoid cleavage dioxygenase-like enzyme